MGTRVYILALVVSFVPAATQASPATWKLTLREAEELALKKHPRVSATFLSALASGEVLKQVRAAFSPLVTLSATGVETDRGSRIAAGGLNNPLIFSRYAQGVSVSQLMTDFGRTTHLTRSAALASQAARETVEATREQILVQVDVAFFTVMRAQAVLRVVEKVLAARRVSAEQVAALEASKLRSSLDVRFANVQVESAKLLAVKAQNDLEAANARLSEAMGSPEQNFAPLEQAMPPAPPNAVESLVLKAVQLRPDLASLRLEYQASVQFARAERDLKKPTVSALAAFGDVPSGSNATLKQDYAAVGVNISLPIFNGGLYTARRRAAEYRAHATSERARELENRVRRDVRVAWLNACSAWKRIGLTDELLKQAADALELAQKRYEMGLGSAVELSQAELNQTSAGIDREGARYDYQVEYAVLLSQIGMLHRQ
jgi:outer membrane protein